MKAGIVGAGALGSLFSHIFQKSGIAFSVYENNISVVNEINSLGLTLTEGEVKETINPAISSSPGILGDVDIIFLFVKSYSTEDAIKSIKSSIKPDSIIVSLQNGIGNFESISKHIDKNRIVLGTTTIGATKTEASAVTLGGKGIVTIGSSSSDSVDSVDMLFRSTEISVNKIFNPQIAVWKKAVVNAGINPIATILDIKNGEILENKFAIKLQESAVREAIDSAIAAGIQIDFNSMIHEVRDICKKTSINTCSMLQDIKNKRRTEIDSINGAIINTAARYGILTPVTETLYQLVKCLEMK